MKTIALVFLLVLFLFESASGQVAFDKYFGTDAVRYDYELIGNADEALVIHRQTKILPQWGGQPEYKIEDFNLGSYNFQLFDVKTGELIFQKGFCPIFWEWQTTAEAKLKKRSFSQSLFFPKPLRNGLLVINTRDKMNKWKSIFTDTIQLSDYFMVNEKPFLFDVDTLLYSGKTSVKIDLVILSEGYLQSEMEKFSADARRLTDSLFKAAPFCNYIARFNVFAVKVPSMESGTDVPGNMIYKNTAFNSHFYTFDSPRYLTTNDLQAVYDALDGIAWDQIYLLVNSDRYGGGGFYNFLNVCSSDHERSPFVFIHEFAHGFAGLADEYYTSSTSYEEYYNKLVEPWEYNLTTLVNFNSKWKKLVSKNTPVPTPRDSIYFNTTGVFEGGGYESKGVYSPAMSCWMKEMSAGKFCPVCEKAIEKVILSQTK